MGQPKRAGARRRQQPGGSTVPDEVLSPRSAKSPVIPRPPRMPSDSGSLPRALDVDLDFADVVGDPLGSFTDGEAAAPTEPCPAEPERTERPTVPVPSSKTSRIRLR